MGDQAHANAHLTGGANRPRGSEQRQTASYTRGTGVAPTARVP